MNNKATPSKDDPGHPESNVSAAAAGRQRCSRCTSSVRRTRRHLAHRLLRVLWPIIRFQYERLANDPNCPWTGTLPAPHREPGLAATLHRTSASDAIVAEAAAGIPFAHMAQITLDSIGDAVLAVDGSGVVIYLNAVAEELTGWSKARAMGRPVNDVFRVVDGKTHIRTDSPAARTMREGRIVELELGSLIVREDGSELAIEDSAAPIRNQFGVIVGAVIVFHDARYSRSMVEKINHQATHDHLTGLANRALLMERLDQATAMAARHDRRMALIFVDLDHFKALNDSLGHAAGDGLLRDIAREMRTCVRTTDVVGRLGGDEFVIVLTEVEKMGDAARVAEKLLKRCAPLGLRGGVEPGVTLSLGISVYPEDGCVCEQLLQCADTAMYRAKILGGNRFQFFHTTSKSLAGKCVTPWPRTN
jgi:diguanylate cyclase (GGDEF)-like protein/PAS domain S-box-containing protein